MWEQEGRNYRRNDRTSIFEYELFFVKNRAQVDRHKETSNELFAEYVAQRLNVELINVLNITEMIDVLID